MSDETLPPPVVYPDGWCPELADRRWPWSAAELAVLRDCYETLGARGCQARLPQRSLATIMSQAHKIGLRRQRPHARPRLATPELDAAIQRFYRRPYPRGAGVVAKFARDHGVTRQFLYRRALQLGLTTHQVPHTPARPWHPDEDAILERVTRNTALETLRKRLRRAGFVRSVSAIAGRLSTLGLARRTDPDAFTANELANLCGVDWHVVERWIQRHGLPAQRSAMGPDGRRDLLIRRGALRRWLIRSADWDHRRVNRAFLIEILSGVSAFHANCCEEAA